MIGLTFVKLRAPPVCRGSARTASRSLPYSFAICYRFARVLLQEPRQTYRCQQPSRPLYFSSAAQFSLGVHSA